MTTTAADNNPATGLFDLPQELLDTIFNLSFPVTFKTRCIPRSRWTDAKEHRAGTTASHIGNATNSWPFPGRKVDRFMVSKRYLQCAAYAFVRTRSFTDFAETTELAGLVGRKLKWPEGVIPAFMTTLSTNLPYFSAVYCAGLPNLLSLTWYIEESRISDAMEPRCAFEDDANQRDFGTFVFETKINRLSGLTKLRCHVEPCKYIGTSEAKAKLEENLRRFEDYLWPIVTRPRSDAAIAPTEAAFYLERGGTEAESGGTPLYFGSRVRA